MKRLLLPFFILVAGFLSAQTSMNFPTTGHQNITSSGMTIYDDGGPNGNCANTADATITLHTTNPSNAYRIKVTQNIYHEPGMARMQIFNGDSSDIQNDGNLVYSSDNYRWWANFWYFYSSGNTITIRYHMDDDDPESGFKIELCEVGGNTASNIQVEYLSNNSIKLNWEESDTTTHWILQWVLSSNDNPNIVFADTNTIIHEVYSDTNFIILNGIDTSQFFLYNLFCQSSAPCNGMGILGSSCPCIYPYNLRFSYDPDSLRVHWNDSPDARYWNIHGSGWDNNYFDTILTDTVFALPYTCSSSDYYYVEVQGNCNHNIMRCNYDWNYPTPSRCVMPGSILRLGVTGESIAFTWDIPSDTVLGYITAYRDPRWQADSIVIIDTIYPDPNDPWRYLNDTVWGLEPNTNYEIKVFTMCDYDNLSCARTNTFTTSLDNCIDYVNIWDLENIHLTWGFYNNPDSIKHFSNYDWYGEGNKWFWGSDRHQPFTDTNAYDHRTNYQLRCIPPGDIASIRLGNDNVGAEAESITYDYYVDSTVYDMLVMKYAVVLQNPNHTSSNQPHFTLEILDSTGVIIDTTCCYADFVASGTLGWNTVPNSNIIWKDWTTIGIDLAPYHDQFIKIRLTTKDCADGGHFGYAYFTMHCDNKRLVLVNKCDAFDSIHIQAPLGFDYKWYCLDDTTTILSTNYDILVPVNLKVYKCICSFVGKPTCNFSLQTVSTNVLPHALMHYYVDTCQQKAYFYNESYVERDTVYNTYTSQIVDSIFFMFDGNQYFTDTLVLDLNQNRIYRPVLYCSLTNSDCEDSVAAVVNVNFAYSKQILGPSDICQGDPLNLTAQIRPVNTPSFHWNTGVNDSILTIIPSLTDNLYSVVLDYNGCHDTLYHHFTVHPIYLDTLNETICQGNTYGNGFNQGVEGQYTRDLTSQYLCDSTVTLNLTVQQYRDTIFDAVLCQGYYYYYGGHKYYTDGTYLDTMRTLLGCDSIRYTLNLTVGSSLEIIDTTICNDAMVAFGNTWLSHPGTYSWVYTNSVGCDSTIFLDLHVHHSFEGTIFDTICEGDRVWFIDHWIDSAGYFTANLLTPDGCDSIRHLNLTTLETSATNLYDTLCHGHRYTVGWNSYGETGIYRDTLCNLSQCDSVITLYLTVTPATGDTIHAEICPNDEYYFAGTSFYTTGTYYQWSRDRNNCDSLTTLFLIVRPTSQDTIYASIIEGERYQEHGFDVDAQGTYSQTFQNIYGCDSTLILIVEVTELESIAGNDATQVKVYPNPTAGMLQVEATDIERVVIYDMQGRIVSQCEECDHIDLQQVAAGTYMVRILTATGTATLRIIKQ